MPALPLRLRRAALTLLWGLLAAGSAQAARVAQFSPQGEVSLVRQVSVRFDAPVVSLGGPEQPAPLTLQCSDARAAEGQGWWTSDRTWVHSFHQPLPPGLRCTAEIAPGFRDLEGRALDGPSRFAFQTRGPALVHAVPGDGGTIEEDQVFLLRFNGAVAPASVQAHAHCAADGLGERVAVRLLDGAERDRLAQAVGWSRRRVPAAQVVALACQRRWAPAAQVRLVLGAGVATPEGAASRQAQTLAFTVREPFRVGMTCERENARAGCLPLRSLRLTFNAPVTAAQARAIRLRPPTGEALAPRLPDEARDDAALVHEVEFGPTLAESTAFTVTLPPGLVDASGRAPANLGEFPLAVATGPMPPLAKFAAAPFGVLERLAEPGSPALMPVTVRRLAPTAGATQARTADPAAGRVQVRRLRLEQDAEIVAWHRRVARFDDPWLPRELAGRWSRTPLPRALDPDRSDEVESRMVSLLQGLPGVETLNLPTPANDRATEVVGLPLTGGFHALEIASRPLGEALLDGRHGAARTMFVRSSALVTNLGVHFKRGRANALAWVTTLDRGQPVAGARVQVSDCAGKPVAQGLTDAEGVVRFEGLPAAVPHCGDGDGVEGDGGAWFVSARATGSDGVADVAFTWSDWSRGIEPWRFDLPVAYDGGEDRGLRAHTVLDRALLRAGETVSMKHFLRQEHVRGLRVPEPQDGEVVIAHEGSGQRYVQPLRWRRTASGGLSAESEFKLPPAARLGQYSVQLALRPAGADAGGAQTLDSARFRVEAFRLPVLQGQLGPADRAPLIGATSVPVDLEVRHLSGGGAAGLATQVSALLRPHLLRFDEHEGFSFAPPRASGPGAAPAADEEGGEDGQDDTDTRLVADKRPLTLDREGRGRMTLDGLPAVTAPQQLLLEASYADPNGEIQTLRHVGTLWPAAVVAGIKTEGWVSLRQRARVQALALGLDGRPAPGTALEVRARLHTVTSTRKRLVGGFYSYDNRHESRDLGVVCSGQADAQGRLACEARLDQAGSVELEVRATDREGRSHRSAATVYVTRQGELWFGGQDHDRMDLVPERRRYEPGETARLQVRMPFRQATALVSVERDGVLTTRVVTLRGQDPTLELKIEPDWGPNVFVSVLALRGRLREVPWYSFFTWGLRDPAAWWAAYRHEGPEHVPPTAMVDLSKPAYRLGVAELQVGLRTHELQVKVQTDRETYPVRAQAQVTVQVTRPDGRPAADAEVALAVVDEALLELAPNPSWDLLQGLWQRRLWGVETATAQMEIVGRRHHGRKAVPAGGGGGRSPTRELFDTLVLWQPAVKLDAQGRARVGVPLNDSLSRFRVVAVADLGADRFGTGQASLRTAQDLQLIAGLPSLVREGDRFQAMFSLRNTTARPMRVAVTARAPLMDTPAQTLEIPAGTTRELSWDVTAPAPLGLARTQTLVWELQAQEQGGDARDALKFSQRIVPAVPLTVQQATLLQLDAPLSLPVEVPTDALPDAQGRPRGGLRLSLQPTLGDGLPGVRDWFQHHPYTCLEQQASKALGLRELARWQALLAQLPSFLDEDGLANYFAPREGHPASGSDVLTAHLLATAHEAARLDPAWALPPGLRDTMLDGLEAFVQGRVERRFWSPRADLTVRKLAAIEALSRHGRATPRLLQSLDLTPGLWPTQALIDWLQILQRLPDVPRHAQRRQEVEQLLRARLVHQGTRLMLGPEGNDAWWWLMHHGDSQAARLLLAVLDEPAWQDDLGRLAAGLIGRQRQGAWATTPANLWGSLALQAFSARREATPVSGSTVATLGPTRVALDWRTATGAGTGAPQAPDATLPWPTTPDPAPLTLAHQGSGRPWVTLQALAAVDRTTPRAAGYQVRKTLTPIEQRQPGRWSRGDLVRVTLDVEAQTDMTWVVLSDPIPAGATLLGSGLGRDSALATRGERREGGAVPVFEERDFEAFRAYFDHLGAGRVRVEYTLRLNQVGEFALPPTRVEAMYAPETFGERPNPRLTVEPLR